METCSVLVNALISEVYLRFAENMGFA